MPTAAEIKHWLALVADARLAASRILSDLGKPAGIDDYDLKSAARYLEDAFEVGLEAHGQAVLKEYLGAQSIPVPA